MRIEKFKLSIDNIASIVIVLYFMLFLLNQIFDNAFYYVQIFTGLAGFLFVFDFNKNKLKKVNLKMILFFSFLYFSMMVSLLSTGNIGIAGVIISLQYVGITILIYKYNINSTIMLSSFFIHTIYFTYHIIAGSDPNAILSASRNIISVIVLIQVILVYISLIRTKKLTYIPAFITFIISFWAIGRAGILSTALILIGMLLFTTNSRNRKKNVLLTIILILMLGLLFIIPKSSTTITDTFIQNYEVIYERTEKVGFQDDSRQMIISEYLRIAKEDFSTILFGVPHDTNKTSIFAYFNYNLHNSYLQAHSYYGGIGFILIIIGSILSLLTFIKQKNFVYFILFLSLLLRISTDTVAFIGIMDPLLYYFILSSSTNCKE